MDLSVVVPIYNESGNLPELHQRLTAVLVKMGVIYELVFVDDASADESLSIVESLADADPKVRYISFSRNFGHQIAVTAGLDVSNGNAVVIMDGDLQDPPELIKSMYEAWQKGVSVVYAQRSQRSGESWFKRTTAYVFYRVLKVLTSVPIPLDTGDFRLIDRQVVEALHAMPERHKFLRGQIAWTGFKSEAIPYERAPRSDGSSGYTIPKMFRLAWDAVTGFSSIPLKLVSWFGFAVSFLAFVLIGYAIWSKFVLGDVVRGWTSLIIVVLFLGGIQLLSIGIIGEYLSRMDANIRNRPLYLVKKSNIPNGK
jgi:polyisoprenyl-phosphate glycosyltransferase